MKLFHKPLYEVGAEGLQKILNAMTDEENYTVEFFGQSYNTTGVQVNCTQREITKQVKLDASMISMVGSVAVDIEEYFFGDEHEHPFADLPDTIYFS